MDAVIAQTQSEVGLFNSELGCYGYVVYLTEPL